MFLRHRFQEMIKLTLSGLPVQWDPRDKKMVFGQGLEPVEPAVRSLKEMQDVLYRDKENITKGEDLSRPLYYMFRDVHLAEHRELFRNEGIRYDITVLVPGTIGKEYVKTAGHYHPCKPGTNLTYPEVYEVLHGRAHYLLQRPRSVNQPAEGVDEVIVVSAGAGDKVLIPSGFGHITINPGPDFLIMSNLVAENFASVYDPIREMKGAAYYELVSGEDGVPVFVPNPVYPSLPPLHFTHPTELPQFFLLKEIPQYRAFIEHYENFDFLTSPEDFQEDFKMYLQETLI